jgi:hypothetical protein
MVGQAVEVLLGLVLIVEFPVRLEEAVTVALALLVFVPNPDTVILELDDIVLEDVIVLELDADPVIVLELVTDAVTVGVNFIVPVIKGDRDPDADAVGVLDGRTDSVPEAEPDDVFDWGGERV